MKKTLFWVVLCLAGLTTLARTGQKLIDWSWSNPGLGYLEQNLPRMNAECPFLDGLVIRVVGKTVKVDGKDWTPSTYNAWNKRAWKYELFDDAIKRFKKLDFGHFTDNFFYLVTSSVDFDWESDEDFAVIAANFGIAAKVAREIGMKGLGLDIEEYGRRFWHLHDHKTDKSLEEYSEIVFRRGQQWGKAVFGEYPDIVLLMPFCLTMRDRILTVPFMNGIIDVMPPTAVIYEGHEPGSYRAKSSTGYTDLQIHLRKLISEVIRPQNVNKARGQVRLAPGFYLDAYFNDNEKTNYYVNELEPERSQTGPVKFLARNMVAAILEAEPYIWIYGEQGSWWKNSQHPRVKRTWDEIPRGEGAAAALAAIVHPLNGMDVTRPTNLVKDPTFQGKDNKWSLWQREDDQKKKAPGNGSVKDGRIVMHKVTQGCFCQGLPVKGGQMYLFYARGGVNNAKGGKATASLCFRDANKWLPYHLNVHLPLPVTGQAEPVWTYLIVPKDATSVSVQCSVSGQSEDGEAFFTEILLEEK